METGIWTAVTTLDDLWDGEMAPYTVDGVDVLLINSGGNIVAFEDKCPHAANPLSTGTLDDEELTCAAHSWTFDPLTGAGRNPANTCLKRYAVKVEDENILVDLTAVLAEAKTDS
jgi:toluene monooxygenase system ferredoxin subunit